MALGTKNRQNQTAELCKQHLRETYRDQLGLVEEFIQEIEGPDHHQNVVSWCRFADVKRSTKEMFERLDRHFEEWLNPPK